MNLTIATLGLFQVAANLVGYRILGNDFIEQYAPFMAYRHRFALMSALAVVLLLPLGVLGAQLARGKAYAVALSKVFFILEIIPIGWILWTWSMPFLPVSPLMILAGLMNAGIAFQIVTVYPVIALIVLTRSGDGRASAS